ncbi:hypothetical protein E4U32_001356 [Claviceps aff. humidiphila group G2b]|nr:hypothetical protein E4U32_001356 [Claviceps aff. humidiphila group G2b]
MTRVPWARGEAGSVCFQRRYVWRRQGKHSIAEQGLNCKTTLKVVQTDAADDRKTWAKQATNRPYVSQQTGVVPKLWSAQSRGDKPLGPSGREKKKKAAPSQVEAVQKPVFRCEMQRVGVERGAL